MTIIDYIRVSTEQQDLDKQSYILLDYAHHHQISISECTEVEISSRKTQCERRITEIIERLQSGDQLIVSESSRLGRNMFETLNLINTYTRMVFRLFSSNNPNYLPIPHMLI